MPSIRPLAICVFSHRGRILVMECTHPATNASWYRPLGGGIEFGERAIDTLHRELREEIDAEIKNLRYLGTLENIFTTIDGERGHEIVLVFDGAFVDATLYECERIAGFDPPQSPQCGSDWMSSRDKRRCIPMGWSSCCDRLDKPDKSLRPVSFF